MSELVNVDQESLRSLVLHREATALIHRYQRLVDAKDLSGLAQIVTDDVVIERIQDGERRGREAFLDLYRRFAASDVETSQHMLTNVEVGELDGGAVEINSCFLAITTHASGEARATWGRYRDEMVGAGSSWRLSGKRIFVVRTAFIEPSSLAAPLMDSFGRRPG